MHQTRRSISWRPAAPPACRWRFGTGLLASAVLCLGLILAPAVAVGQGGTVTGTVVNEETLRPLAGAQIVVEGTGRGTITDADGRFLITGLEGGQVNLEVQLIGYEPVTRMVDVGATEVRIALAESAVELDEVVVTGTAGATRRRAIGNAVASVDAAEVVETQPINNVQDLVNGRAAGVVILPGTGQVGSGARIRVRGLSSLSLSQEPLLYVDGVRVNNAQGTGPSTQGFGSRVISRMNDFNPEDIESIEIIKGPAAATLYGTEAANGVIQIITKKGSAGTPRFTFSVKQGANWFANPGDRIYTNWGPDLRTCADPDAPSAETCDIISINQFELEESGANRLNGGGEDLFRTGHRQEYDLSVSGGSETIRYYLGGNWESNEGVEIDNELQQYSARANITVTPHPTVDVTASLGYVNGKTDLSWESGAGGITWTTYFATPENLFNPDGSINFRRGFWSGTPEVYYLFEDWQDLERFTGSIQVNHRPLDWFTHRLSIGTDQTWEENVELVERNRALEPFFPGSATGFRSQLNNQVSFNTLDYSGTFNFDVREGLTSNTTFGLQVYGTLADTVQAFGEDFPAPGLRSISAAAIQRGEQDAGENATVGVFAQQQFEWQDRLFITGAIRADDNSAFGEDFDLIYYPKVSASWVASEEPFWSSAWEVLETLRVRAAYGESGLQPTNFAAIRTFAPVTGPDDISAITPEFVGNPDLGPEVSREIEVGFDAEFLDNRASLEFTYYNSTTEDAILLRDIAPSTGFSGTQFINAGEINNTGIELLARVTPVATRMFDWDVSLNLATNDNEIESLGDPDLEFVTAGTFQEHRVGFPVASWFEKRLVNAELDAEGNPINLMCDNGSGGVVACGDAPRVFLGRSTPDLEGSVTTSVTIANRLRIGALFDFKQGYTKLDGDRRVRCWFFDLCRENWFPLEFDPVEIAGIEERFANDILFDAGFTKFRELSVTYTFPAQWARRFGAASTSLTVAGRNLYTWTDYPGMEPEAMFLSTNSRRGSGQAVWEQNVVPQLQQFVATLNVTF